MRSKSLYRTVSALLLITTIYSDIPVRGQSSIKRSSTARSTPSTFENPGLVKKYQQAISSESLAARLHYLASDHFEGRGTGARGQRMAAQYLASQYQQMGLAPAVGGKPSSALSPTAFLQQFSLYRQMP